MKDFRVGQICIPKAGKEQGRRMIVKSVCGDYVYLVDGHLRTIAKPKKKKQKHVQPTGAIAQELVDEQDFHKQVLDAHVRKALRAYDQKQ